MTISVNPVLETTVTVASVADEQTRKVFTLDVGNNFSKVDVFVGRNGDFDLKTEGTDYDFDRTGTNNYTAVVTFREAQTAGDQIKLRRATVIEQQTNYEPGRVVRADTLEKSVDIPIAALQEVYTFGGKVPVFTIETVNDTTQYLVLQGYVDIKEVATGSRIQNTAGTAVNIKGVTGEQGQTGEVGNHGYSPVFAIHEDDERRVLGLIGYIQNTESNFPHAASSSNPYFISSDGYTTTIRLGEDIRGPRGLQGERGPQGNPSTVAGPRGERGYRGFVERLALITSGDEQYLARESLSNVGTTGSPPNVTRQYLTGISPYWSEDINDALNIKGNKGDKGDRGDIGNLTNTRANQEGLLLSEDYDGMVNWEYPSLTLADGFLTTSTTPDFTPENSIIKSSDPGIEFFFPSNSNPKAYRLKKVQGIPNEIFRAVITVGQNHAGNIKGYASSAAPTPASETFGSIDINRVLVGGTRNFHLKSFEFSSNGLHFDVDENYSIIWLHYQDSRGGRFYRRITNSDIINGAYNNLEVQETVTGTATLDLLPSILSHLRVGDSIDIVFTHTHANYPLFEDSVFGGLHFDPEVWREWQHRASSLLSINLPASTIANEYYLIQCIDNLPPNMVDVSHLFGQEDVELVGNHLVFGDPPDHFEPTNVVTTSRNAGNVTIASTSAAIFRYQEVDAVPGEVFRARVTVGISTDGTLKGYDADAPGYGSIDVSNILGSTSSDIAGIEFTSSVFVFGTEATGALTASTQYKLFYSGSGHFFSVNFTTNSSGNFDGIFQTATNETGGEVNFGSSPIFNSLSSGDTFDIVITTQGTATFTQFTNSLTIARRQQYVDWQFIPANKVVALPSVTAPDYYLLQIADNVFPNAVDLSGLSTTIDQANSYDAVNAIVQAGNNISIVRNPTDHTLTLSSSDAISIGSASIALTAAGIAPTFTAAINNGVMTFNLTIPFLPTGGNPGEVLTKDSTTNYDISWSAISATHLLAAFTSVPAATSIPPGTQTFVYDDTTNTLQRAPLNTVSS